LLLGRPRPPTSCLAPPRAVAAERVTPPCGSFAAWVSLWSSRMLVLPTLFAVVVAWPSLVTDVALGSTLGSCCRACDAPRGCFAAWASAAALVVSLGRLLPPRLHLLSWVPCGVATCLVGCVVRLVVEGPFSLFLAVCCCVVVVVFGVLTTLFVVLYPALYPSCFRPPLLNAKIREVVFEKKKTSWQLKLCNSLYQFPQSLSNPSALSSDDGHVWDRVSRGGGRKKPRIPLNDSQCFWFFSNHVKDYDYFFFAIKNKVPPRRIGKRLRLRVRD
jgi:hypothetical protein